MRTILNTLFTAAIAVAPISASLASERAPGASGIVPSTVLVRVEKLTGLDANNREQVLFKSEKGVLIPLTQLAGIGARLTETRPQVAEGAYHGLKLQLANEARIYGSPTGPVHTQLRSDGKPEVVNMLGAVVVAKNEFQPLALAIDTGSNFKRDQNLALASRDYDRRHERDEDEDDD